MLANNQITDTDLNNSSADYIGSYAFAANPDSIMDISTAATPNYITTFNITSHFTYKSYAFANQKYADITITDDANVESNAFYGVYNVNYNGDADTSTWGCLNVNYQPVGS